GAGVVGKEKMQRIGGGVGYRDHNVCVHDVVNQGIVFAADALDIVLAIAIIEHGRTFERFDSDGLGAVQLLEPVARRNCAGRSGSRDKSRQPIVPVSALEMLEYGIERSAGAVVMNEVVWERGELIDDDVLFVIFQLGAFVIYFLDVALGARRTHDIGWIGYPALKPIEPLAAHAGRQHRRATAAQDARDRDTAAAVVAGRWPYCAIAGRIELSGDKTRHKTRIGSQHLVRSDHREAAAQQYDERRPYAG